MTAATSSAGIAGLLAEVRGYEVDRESIPQELLDVRGQRRTNALPWRGQFTPGLPALLIEHHGPDGLVLDPFAGSGTTLGEAGRMGLPSAGTEVNPAAFSLCAVYELAGLPAVERSAAVSSAEVVIEQCVTDAEGLFAGSATVELLLAERARLSSDDPVAERLLVATLMLAMGNTASATPPTVTRAWRQVRELVSDLPATPVPTSVLASDARRLPLEDGTAAMIVTSPPYINVFNYHQNYRPAMELLGWDVLPAARSEIGSNRKHRANRLLTVVQYCLDMAQTLDEMARVLVPEAPMVIVVGRESKVLGLPFPNGELIATLGSISGRLDLVNWQERSFVSRFGETVYEELLTFRRGPASADQQRIEEGQARALGRTLLEEALDGASSDSAVFANLTSAVAAADSVCASPELALSRSGTAVGKRAEVGA